MDADTTARCAYMFETLKKHGVNYLEVTFYGSGDDGQLDFGSVGFVDKSKEKENPNLWDEETIFGNDLGSLVEEVAGGVIDFYDIDYCNNEGNDGSIFFDISSGRITTNYRIHTRAEENLYI